MKSRQFPGSAAERTGLLMGCAGAAVLLTAPTASALVVEYGPGLTLATSPAQTGTFKVVGINLDGEIGNAEFQLTFYRSAWALAWANTGKSFALALHSTMTTAAHGMPLLQGFASTASIASHLAWGTATAWGAVFRGPGGTGAGTWMGQLGYLGYRAPDGGGGHTYGWVQIGVNDPLTRVTILNWSVAATGSAESGAAGAAGTPEPAATGLGLLALGAAGILRHKRRRKEQAA